MYLRRRCAACACVRMGLLSNALAHQGQGCAECSAYWMGGGGYEGKKKSLCT